jgi:DNA-binding protein WhiA
MAVSFSAAAKAEICRSFSNRSCCALAACFGILLFANSFSSEGIRIVTESREFAELLPKLFKKAFNLTFDVLPDGDSGGKQTFQITRQEKLGTIMNAYGFDPAGTVSLHVNLPIVEDDCCKAAFLRGAFLAGGSVTDPGKGYHLEIATTHYSDNLCPDP